MEHEHVISGFRRKRAEIAGEINQCGKRLVHLRADLVCIDQAIVIFDPARDPEAIRPLAVRKKPDHFRRGDFTRAIMAVMRHAERPITAREIAGQLSAQHGVGTGGPHVMNGLVQRVRAALGRLNGRTLANDGKPGAVALWRINDSFPVSDGSAKWVSRQERPGSP